MSDSLINSPQPNNQPDPAPATPAHQDHHPSQTNRPDRSRQANASDLPLPDFNDPAEPAPAQPPMAPHYEEDSSEPDDAELEPGYKLSPAEPADWSEFIAPASSELGAAEPEAQASRSSWQTAWAVIREVGETIILTLIIFLLIQTVIRNFRVVGTSMVDNLHDGQYLIIDKLSYNPLLTNILGLGGPVRGDVIVFEPPNRPGEDYVKRIIALPGETVEVINGQVFINGAPLEEPFQPGGMSYTMRPQVVPAGTVFVLGDNRNNSNDSHNWGPLPVENIVGRAWLSYWPPENWGAIPRDAPTETATLKHWLVELVPNASAGSE